MSHVRFREHMDLSKSISERIAERKRKGEEEAARRRGIAEGLPVSSVLSHFSTKFVIRVTIRNEWSLSTAHQLEQLPLSQPPFRPC